MVSRSAEMVASASRISTVCSIRGWSSRIFRDLPDRPGLSTSLQSSSSRSWIMKLSRVPFGAPLSDDRGPRRRIGVPRSLTLASPLYWSPWVYRLVMRALYGRAYDERYRVVADLVPNGSHVVDLCCGCGYLYTGRSWRNAGSRTRASICYRR